MHPSTSTILRLALMWSCAAPLTPACGGGGDAGDHLAPTVTIALDGGETLRFSVSEEASLIECAFDGGGFTACGAGRYGQASVPAALVDGDHTATVRATDLAGNPGEPATLTFTVRAPELTVTIAPSTAPCPARAIDFGASLAGATFACALDGQAAAPCASPFTLPAGLTEGAHTFAVTASAQGKTASTAAPVFIDLTRPEVTIAGVLPDPDASGRFDRTGLILFASSKPVAALCGIDGHDPVDCGERPFDGAFAFAGLDDQRNPHLFKVQVTDSCGRRASARLELDVDTTPPAPCLVAATTEGGAAFDDGGGCLAETATTGADGSLTFAAEPGAYRCTLTTEIFDTPFDCAPGEPIRFAALLDAGDDPHPYALIVEGVDVHGNQSRTALRWLVQR